MSYISLYRKYRSQTFSDVMGQEHVTRTLQNAIRAGRIAHAYLFCGSRGTGKTTVARILARALNCEKGPTPDPCNQCEACRAIIDGSAVDVIEMDAASHRSVEDIDALRDAVKYPPMQLRYKVYIIDEAHQLSSTAKDAFLKTLEEPPVHAVFILATTEAHQIPLTIRSRCQQFDFRRGTLRDISARLKYVAGSEGVVIDEDAVDMIARAAAGSWRDGLSLLEQVMAFTEDRITLRDVITVLGGVERETLFEIGECVADRDAAKAFALAEKLVAEGRDIRELLRAIAGHFRDLLYASAISRSSAEGERREEKAGPSPSAQEGTGEADDHVARLRGQASKLSYEKLLWAVEVFSEADKQTKWSDQHRMLLEMALLKAMEGPTVFGQAAARDISVPAGHVFKAFAAEETASVEAKPPAGKAPAARPVPKSLPKTAPVVGKEKAEQAPERKGAERLAEELEEAEVAIEEVQAGWPSVVRIFKGSKDASLFPILSRARPLRVENGSTVVIGLPAELAFNLHKIEEPKYREAIIKTIAHVLKKKVGLKTETFAAELETTREATTEELEVAESSGAQDVIETLVSAFPGSRILPPEPADEELLENPWEDDEDAKDA